MRVGRAHWAVIYYIRSDQRLFCGKACLTADRGRRLLWGNEAEVVSTTTRRPPHHVAVSRVLGEGLALGRAAFGVVSTTATSTRLLPLLGRRSRATSSLTTRPAPSAHRAAHQEVLWCSR